MYFKTKALARQDVLSYSRDKFGSIAELSAREGTIKGFKFNAGSKENETNFKEGLSLLDDIDFIQAGRDRAKVLEIFRKNKISHLPDGRAIEDIVK